MFWCFFNWYYKSFFQVIKRKYRDQQHRKKSLQDKLSQALQNLSTQNLVSQENSVIKDDKENKSENENNIENHLITDVKSIVVDDSKQNKNLESIDNKPIIEQNMKNDDAKIFEMSKISISEQIAGLRIMREVFIRYDKNKSVLFLKNNLFHIVCC